MTDVAILREELKFFESRRAEWLERHEGKFALIKGSTLVDTFDTAENAYVAGVQQFGNVPFLVKQIVRQERTERLPALSLGLLRAHP